MLDIEIAILVLFVFSPIIIAVLYKVARVGHWLIVRRRQER